jgi:hypothetical protein
MLTARYELQHKNISYFNANPIFTRSTSYIETGFQRSSLGSSTTNTSSVEDSHYEQLELEPLFDAVTVVKPYKPCSLFSFCFENGL